MSAADLGLLLVLLIGHVTPGVAAACVVRFKGYESGWAVLGCLCFGLAALAAVVGMPAHPFARPARHLSAAELVLAVCRRLWSAIRGLVSDERYVGCPRCETRCTNIGSDRHVSCPTCGLRFRAVYGDQIMYG